MKPIVLRLVGLIGSTFLATTAGYFVYGMIVNNIPEPILWVRTIEEVYFTILTMLGIAGMVVFTIGIKRHASKDRGST